MNKIHLNTDWMFSELDQERKYICTSLIGDNNDIFYIDGKLYDILKKIHQGDTLSQREFEEISLFPFVEGGSEEGLKSLKVVKTPSDFDVEPSTSDLKLSGSAFGVGIYEGFYAS